MTRVVLAERIHSDTSRIAEHLRRHQVTDVDSHVDEIFDALDLPQRHPLIGRPAGSGLRELVIGRGTHGYVARYRFDEAADLVHVLAVRAQREAGFSDD